MENLIPYTIGCLIGLSIIVFLYVAVAKMAEKRSRSVILWLILSFLIGPLLPMIILAFLGKRDTNSSNSID